MPSFFSELKPKKHVYAYFWLFVGCVAWGAAYWAALEQPATTPPTSDFAWFWRLPPVGWSDRHVWVVIVLAGLIGLAILMHAFDVVFSGGGFRYQYRESDSLLQLDDSMVSGVLTVQSIRTAVTTFILAALAAQLPKRDGQVQWQSVDSFAFFIGMVTGGVLLVSLITTLVATLCFDYSLRFTWTTRESPTRDTAKAKPLAESTKFWLRRKAQRLNAFGFYCLMWSLAALPALLDWYASMISALVVYLVTWGYYFFPVSAKPVLKTALPTPDALVRAVTTLVNQASNQVAAAAAAKAAAEAQTSANQASEAAQQALEKLKVATDAAEQAKTKAATAAEKLTPPA